MDGNEVKGVKEWNEKWECTGRICRNFMGHSAISTTCGSSRN